MQTEVTQAGILKISFDLAPVNALDLDNLEHLHAALFQTGGSNIRGIVLCGRNNTFCAGLHKDVFERNQIAEATRLLRGIVRRMAMTEIPMAAGIAGGCVGAGLIFALTCDYRVAAPKARLSLPELSLGVPISAQVFALVRYWGGCALARDICLNGRELLGPAALGAGLVDRISYPDHCASQAEAWVTRLLGLPTNAMRATYLNMRRDIGAIYAEETD